MKACAPPTNGSPACPATPSRRTTESTTTACGRSACTISTKVRATRADGAAAPRRAVVELPVSQDDPGARRGRASRDRARPRRLRPLGQAGRAQRLHLPAPRRLDAGGPRRGSTPGITLVCQDWGGLIGLRLVAEHPGALRARRRGQHRSCRPATSTGRGVPRLAGVLAGGADVPDVGGSSTAAASPLSPPRWWRPTTRRSPTRPTRRARASSRCSCRRGPTIRRRRRTAPRGTCCAQFHKPFLTAFSDSTHHRGRRRAPAGADSRARRASRTPPSRAVATSCRRIRARRWRAWS